jgi:hypothetical protein
MIIGQYYSGNQRKFSGVKESEWKVVLKKCEKHIRIRLKQRMSSGVHTAANLGTNPVEHYMETAYTKLLAGDWEWKDTYNLLEQMIRIIDKAISVEVEKYKTDKAQALKIEYTDVTDEFYVPDDHETSKEDEETFKAQCEALQQAAAGDDELVMIYEAICEGLKRADIAELLGKTPKQFDKLKEKLINRVKKTK